MASHDKSVFIVIVNWNNVKDTIECLDSILETEHSSKRIVLVDNGSTDNSVIKLRERAHAKKLTCQIINEKNIYSGQNRTSEVTIIALAANYGFAYANNEGIRHSISNDADYVLLLNNDTVVKKNFLTKMLTAFENLSSDPVGIMGCKIRYYHQRDKIWFSGGSINYLKGAFYHRTEDCEGVRESDFITGCCMLMSTRIFERVGFLDEQFFLNVEDIDFSYRTKMKGFKLFVNCDAEIYHKVSASIGGLYSLRNQYYFHRNRMLFFAKYLKGFKKVAFYFMQFTCAIPAWMLLQLISGKTQAIKGASLGYFDFINKRSKAKK